MFYLRFVSNLGAEQAESTVISNIVNLMPVQFILKNQLTAIDLPVTARKWLAQQYFDSGGYIFNRPGSIINQDISPLHASQ